MPVSMRSRYDAFDDVNSFELLQVLMNGPC